MSKALVTGGASGIGAATVRRLRRDGMLVAALDVDSARLAGIDAEAHVVADVTSEEDVGRGVDEAAAALGGLDVVVACAGVAGRGTVAETPLDEWERVFSVNTRGVYLTAKAAIPHLREAGGGALVVVASQLGLVAAADAAAYCASKGAVVQLTRAMAVDHGVEGIRVNCVCPGPTATPLLDEYFKLSADPGREQARYADAQVHGRLIEPEEVADAIAYLASPGASSTMGAALVVDGGYSIR
ncbi:MAG TPA: SDR family oxidoreductase [Gaiellaceae bacterium]|nr:SDR family oxidoreductase [Gaiellaceae bacterium]